MKLLACANIVFLMLLLACEGRQQQTKQEPTVEENILQPIKKKIVENKRKTSIKTALKQEYGGDYMLTFMDSTVSLLDPLDMYRPFRLINISSLQTELKGFEFKALSEDINQYEFSRGDSKIRFQQWEVDEVNAEYYELSGIIIKGNLKDPNVVFDMGIRVGMSKQDLFAIYFTEYETYLDSVSKIVVYEDESANDATVYRFENSLLAEIEFGSYSY